MTTISVKVPASLVKDAKKYGVDLSTDRIKSDMLRSVYQAVNQARLEFEYRDYCDEIDANPDMSEDEKDREKAIERDTMSCIMMGR